VILRSNGSLGMNCQGKPPNALKGKRGRERSSSSLYTFNTIFIIMQIYPKPMNIKTMVIKNENVPFVNMVSLLMSMVFELYKC
jgi:hypothetical protein